LRTASFHYRAVAAFFIASLIAEHDGLEMMARIISIAASRHFAS
jgi:hypothetical protein